MEKEIEEKLLKSGKIAAQALQFAQSLIKPGASLLEVTEKTEEKIKELGGKLAFPVQISLNDTAAHFCPDADDKTIFKDQLASIDVGVHIDGWIGGDNALTIDLSGKNQDLVNASREALNNALKLIKPGITLTEIGKTIQETITKHGFSPIRNLGGHGLGKFDIHTKPTIPNYDNGDTTKLKQDMVIAIEPFASAGAGLVYESSPATIFQIKQKRPVRNMITRQVMKEIQTYHDLPFCRRWLVKKFGLPKTLFALRELKSLEILREYPPLPDKNHGLVSQAENTVLITKDGCRVLTRVD